MQNFKIGLSLRYKLLLLLTLIPLASLSLYLMMATDLFQKDKLAYVFDSSAAVSRSAATQMRMELNGAYTAMRPIAEQYDVEQKTFSPVAQGLFEKNPKIYAITLFKHDESGQYTQIGQLTKDKPEAQAFAADAASLNSLRDEAAAASLVVKEGATGSKFVKMAYRLGDKTDANHLVLVALYDADDLLSAFESGSLYTSFVVTRSGQISLGSAEVAGGDLSLLGNILHSVAGEGTAESKLTDGMVYLISYSAVGLGDMLVISKVDKAKALKAVEVLVVKSLLFFAALIATTLLISVIAASRLTSALRDLFDATQKIAQGDFTVRVEAKSKDEVGGLAESFNWMAAEVSRLMTETAEKARMESELGTVRAVQETLFPPSQSQFGPLNIVGHFEPASECGGDWWNYSRVGNKIFLWIGDATGHGAPAALITSAARSAAAVIESMPDITPGRALSVLNRAIHQTSKGQIMMTFFILAIDVEQNSFAYACASHDPPYLIKKGGAEHLTKQSLIPLNDVNGPRLGDMRDFQYKEITVQMDPGDFLFFYTDGILDIQDLEGKKWGERNFLRGLLDSINVGTNGESRVTNLRDKIEKFRQGSALIDDVTMILCEYEKKAS